MPKVRSALSHPWRITAEEAADIQRSLAAHVVGSAVPASGAGSPAVVAGVDVAYTKEGARAWAAVVSMDMELRVLESRVVSGTPDRPYAPGFLAFREGRMTLEALSTLKIEPDLVFLDGHGVVHERGLGLASHVGVLLDLPTIGVPKTPFHAIDRLPGKERGSFYVLTKEWGAQGASVRLRTGVKPVYVSPGHRMDLESAIALSLRWSTGRHKVPEPLQAAHTLASKTRSDWVAETA